MSYYDDCDGDCRLCGRRDYGFDLPDVRSTFEISGCRCAKKCIHEDEDCPCEEGCRAEEGCDDSHTVTIRINRIYDRECPGCGCFDWRPEWVVQHDGKTVATVPTEEAAEAVVAAVYPEAQVDRDPDWESERWIRRAEGWGE